MLFRSPLLLACTLLLLARTLLLHLARTPSLPLARTPPPLLTRTPPPQPHVPPLLLLPRGRRCRLSVVVVVVVGRCGRS